MTAHEHMHQGDVSTGWALPDPLRKDALRLVIRFKSPVPGLALIDLDLKTYGGFIDQVVANDLLYIGTGRPGDRFSDVVVEARPHIIVEIDCSDFAKPWEEIITSFLERAGRERGLKRAEARRYAREVKSAFRDFGEISRIG